MHSCSLGGQLAFEEVWASRGAAGATTLQPGRSSTAFSPPRSALIFPLIPAQAGIQSLALDPRLRGDERGTDSCEDRKFLLQLRRRDQLGPVFEMHGVEVIPLAAPDEAVALEDLDDGRRNAVAPARRVLPRL